MINKNIRRRTDIDRTVVIPVGAVSVRRDDPPPKLARGTRHDIDKALGRAKVNMLPPPTPGAAMWEHQLGMMWMVDLQVETFARNVAVAGALECARRMGEIFPRAPDVEIMREWDVDDE